jgi:hypothetical protein
MESCTEARMLSLALQSMEGVEGAAVLLVRAMAESGWTMPVVVVPYVALALGSIEGIWLALADPVPARRLGRAFAALALFRDWPPTMCGWPVVRAAEDGRWICTSRRCRHEADGIEPPCDPSSRSDILELHPGPVTNGIAGTGGDGTRCAGT